MLPLAVPFINRALVNRDKLLLISGLCQYPILTGKQQLFTYKSARALRM